MRRGPKARDSPPNSDILCPPSQLLFVAPNALPPPPSQCLSPMPLPLPVDTHSRRRSCSNPEASRATCREQIRKDVGFPCRLFGRQTRQRHISTLEDQIAHDRDIEVALDLSKRHTLKSASPSSVSFFFPCHTNILGDLCPCKKKFANLCCLMRPVWEL